MCKYCENLLEYNGNFYLNTSKQKLYYEDDDWPCVGSVEISFCPFCGKKLGESDDKNVKWLVEVDGELFWFNKEQAAIEKCEGEAEDGYLVNLYRVRIENKRTCQMAVMPVWD